jgi:hypothetical protein
MQRLQNIITLTNSFISDVHLILPRPQQQQQQTPPSNILH